ITAAGLRSSQLSSSEQDRGGGLQCAGPKPDYVLSGGTLLPCGVIRALMADALAKPDEGNRATDHPIVGRSVRQQAGDDDAAGAADAPQFAGAGRNVRGRAGVGDGSQALRQDPAGRLLSADIAGMPYQVRLARRFD